MAYKRSYWELLKDPRWQRKRLEILNRDGFACENCAATDKPLHIHHAYYEKGLAPWEYPDDSLHTLCEDCHKKAQDVLALLQRQIGKLSGGSIEQLYGYALGLETVESGGLAVIEVASYEAAHGVADVWWIRTQAVIDALIDHTIDGQKLSALQDVQRDKR